MRQALKSLVDERCSDVLEIAWQAKHLYVVVQTSRNMFAHCLGSYSSGGYTPKVAFYQPFLLKFSCLRELVSR